MIANREGWDAAWVDGVRNMNRVGYADRETVGVIPDRVQAVLHRIEAQAGGAVARPWDVLAWHDDTAAARVAQPT